METRKELNERIVAVTLEIQENYPELHKYITEMTDGMPDEKTPDVDNQKLRAYYESLLEMVKKYKEGVQSPEHNKPSIEKTK
jgi:hypothetical protein